MRWQIGLLGLLIGLASADANAQLVARDKVTTTSLAEKADLIILGKVGSMQAVGDDEHQGLLISIGTERVVKGPADPGEIQVFTWQGSSSTVPFEEGERPLLFLSSLDKDELACTDCQNKGREVITLPDGNYYLVRGGRWGKIMPGEPYGDHVAETIRLQTQADFLGLKDHMIGAMENPEERVAVDSVIDLLVNEKARDEITGSDATALVALLQSSGDRFRPLEPLILLVGHTGAAEAVPPLVNLARSEGSASLSVFSSTLSRLSESGVDVASALLAELDSAAVSFDAKARFLRIVGAMKETQLTDTVIALAAQEDLRKSALLALGDLKDLKGLPTLRDALEAGEMKDRQAAAVALAYFGPEGVEAIKEFQSAHPDDELTRFIDELRRNPAQVRRRVQ